MQSQTHTLRNLLIALAAIGLVVFAGYAYVKRDQSADSLLTSSAPVEAGSADSDLLSALFQLKRLKLDDSVFRDPSWTSLSDFGRQLQPENLGRSNPFAPF